MKQIFALNSKYLDIAQQKQDLAKQLHLNNITWFITWLQVEFMVARGTLNCRGMLKFMLLQVKMVKYGCGAFNATKTCENLEENGPFSLLERAYYFI